MITTLMSSGIGSGSKETVLNMPIAWAGGWIRTSPANKARFKASQAIGWVSSLRASRIK
jgi:hypothetical protein